MDRFSEEIGQIETERPIKIGFIARVDPEKSIGIFLHVAIMLSNLHLPEIWNHLGFNESGGDNYDFEFSIAGDGSLRSYMESAIQPLVTTYSTVLKSNFKMPKIKFLGSISNNLHNTIMNKSKKEVHLGEKVKSNKNVTDVISFLRSIDLLINPSLRAWAETFCIVNIEAMACGIPVVSFGAGGTGEYFCNPNSDRKSVTGKEDGEMNIFQNFIEVKEAFPENVVEAILRNFLPSMKSKNIHFNDVKASLNGNDQDPKHQLTLNARYDLLKRDFTIEKMVEKYDRLYTYLYHK